MHGLVKRIQIGIEKIYVKSLRLKHIPNSPVNLLYVDIKKYKGKPLLIGEERIKKGDQVIEFHIDNLNVNMVDGSFRSIIKNFRIEMKCLSEALENDKRFEHVKGAYAVTVLHPMLTSIGFLKFPLSNKLYAGYLRFWENMLRTSFGAGNKNQSKKRDPMICWILPEEIKKQGQK